MATNERRALLRHLGLKLIEHAAVEVRPIMDSWSGRATDRKFAVLKDFSEATRIWVGDPASVERYAGVKKHDGTLNPSYQGYLNTSGVDLWGYADWPVRIEGLFANTGGGTYFKYETDQYGQQWYWKITGSTARRHEVHGEGMIDLRHLKPITMQQVERRHRKAFIWGYAQMLMQRDDTSRRVRDAAAVMQQRLHTMFGFAPTHAWRDRGYIDWRQRMGLEPTPASGFLELRRLLKEMGTLIGAKNTDPQDFIDALAKLQEHPVGFEFSDTLVHTWSRLHPTSDLIRCGCGHPEVRGEVTEALGGRTVCRHCIATGRYRMFEDLQQYGEGGYQHPDGLTYSYPYLAADEDDPDYDPDEEPTPGVRNYSADVRSFLKRDDSIVPSSYGEFLMGIELEVVPEYDRANSVDHTIRTLGQGYAIMKDDGSLDDGGFEIVTAPRGLKEHIERFSKWKPYNTLRAWDAGCCGMHVHLSSQAFTQATLGKFIEFINAERNDNFIRAIAGRHPRWDSQAENYCQRDGCRPGNPKKTLECKDPSRYYMVNSQNITSTEAKRLGLSSDHASGRPQNTIEIRVFRASLKKSRLLAQIEFAHAAVMFCRWSSMRELDEAHFLKWLKGMAGVYPNLAKWFGVRANTEVVEATPQARSGAEV